MAAKGGKRKIEQYRHEDKQRANNPPVGLVNADTERDEGKKKTGDKEGWAKLARNLKAEIDEDMIEAYRGTLSLPFDLGANQRVAVKIIDDRGIESLRVIAVD